MSNTANKTRVYKISRGNKYSCLVTIKGGEAILVTDIKHPSDATDNIISVMMDDAEKEALKKFNEEIGSG